MSLVLEAAPNELTKRNPGSWMQYYQAIKKASTKATAGMKQDLFEFLELLLTVVILGL